MSAHKNNVSRDLLDYFERSTARVNAQERARVRSAHMRLVVKVAFVVVCFVAGVLATCGR